MYNAVDKCGHWTHRQTNKHRKHKEIIGSAVRKLHANKKLS